MCVCVYVSFIYILSLRSIIYLLNKDKIRTYFYNLIKIVFNITIKKYVQKLTCLINYNDTFHISYIVYLIYLTFFKMYKQVRYNFLYFFLCSGNEPINATRYTNCGHFFCKQCVGNDSLCIICKTPVQPIETCSDHLIESLVSHCNNIAEIIQERYYKS